VWEEKVIKDMVKFFKSIGMEWINAEYIADGKNTIDIEFINTPDILKTYSTNDEPSISNISSLGISFILFIIPNTERKVTFISEDGNIDGVVFCPMSNIKVINGFGGLNYEDNTKIEAKKELLKRLNS